MPIYEYMARDVNAKLVSGNMEAANESDLVNKLKSMNYCVTKITEFKAKGGVAVVSGVRKIKINQNDVLKFSLKLVSLIQAGISLPVSIRILRDQTINPKFKEIINDIYNKIDTGTSFSNSLSYYPKTFPNIMIRMVEVGEATGKLENVLLQYVGYAENQAKIRSQVKSALTYPIAVIVVAGMVLFVFTGFVIPKFIEVFKESNITLPLPTQIMVGLSYFVKHYSIHTFLAITAVFIGYKLAKRNKKFIGFVDAVKLKIPFVSVLLGKMVQSHFAQTIGLLYQCGVPILDSIKISERIVGNTKYARSLQGLYDHVKDGKSITEYIRADPLYNDDLVEMVNIGESTGRLAEMMQKSAYFYREEIDRIIKDLLQLLEPVIICCLGAFIAFLGLSIIMPIFKMMAAIG